MTNEQRERHLAERRERDRRRKADPAYRARSSAYLKAYRAAHKDELRERRGDPERRIAALLRSARARAQAAARDDSPSIDRIDPRLGYLPGNVWIICNRANRIKSDGTAREHLVIALAMAARVANVVGHGKRDLERALRDAGLSISLSKRLIASGFTALREAAAGTSESVVRSATIN
jgi:hypothetical protein